MYEYYEDIRCDVQNMSIHQRGVSWLVGYAQARLIYDQLVLYNFQATTVFCVEMYLLLESYHYHACFR